MSDDFQVKQSSSSSGAYGLTGGVIGAAAGGFGSYHFTKPKYGTYDDLIAEKQDSFESKLKGADGEDKKFLDAVNDLRNAKTKAEEEYEAAIKAATEGGEAVTDDGQKAVDAAKKKLENKKNALIDAEYKKRGETNVNKKEQKLENQLKEVTKKQKEAVKKINVKLVEIAAEKNKLAAEYANATSKADKKKILDKLNKLDDKIRLLSLNKDLEFGTNTKAKAEFVDKMKEVVANLQAKADVESIPAEISELSKLEVEAETVTKTLGKYIPVAEQIDAKNNAVYDEIRTAITNKDKDGLRKAVEKLPPEYQAVINEIKGDKPLISEKELNRAITKIDEKAADTLVERIIRIEEKFNKQAEEMDKVYTSIKEALTKNDKKALEEAFAKLPANQQEKLNEVLKNGWVLKDFEEAIPQLKELNAVEHNEFKKSMDALKEYQEKVKKIGGEGAHIIQVTEDGKTVNRLVDKDGNLVYKKLNAKNIKTRVGIPANTEVTDEINKKLAELREPEQKIKEEIAKGLKEADYAEELKAVKEAEKAAEEAKKNAANQEKLSLDKATEKVNEKFGVKDKAEYIKNKTKSEADNITNNFKKQIERKWGFEGNTSWKVAGAAALGAIVLGGIFSAMAPKNKA